MLKCLYQGNRSDKYLAYAISILVMYSFIFISLSASHMVWAAQTSSDVWLHCRVEQFFYVSQTNSQDLVEKEEWYTYDQFPTLGPRYFHILISRSASKIGRSAEETPANVKWFPGDGNLTESQFEYNFNTTWGSADFLHSFYTVTVNRQDGSFRWIDIQNSTIGYALQQTAPVGETGSCVSEEAQIAPRPKF